MTGVPTRGRVDAPLVSGLCVIRFAMGECDAVAGRTCVAVWLCVVVCGCVWLCAAVCVAVCVRVLSVWLCLCVSTGYFTLTPSCVLVQLPTATRNDCPHRAS